MKANSWAPGRAKAKPRISCKTKDAKKTAHKAARRKTTLPAQPSDPEVVSVAVPDSSWTRDRLIAKIAVDGTMANANTIQTYAYGQMGEHGSMSQTIDSLQDKIKASKEGSTAVADELLIGQAVALNAVFNECMRRAALNMGEYPDAMERYMRVGFKAQSLCRASFESLAKINNPPNVAFVRQANIANGPQQVNNGTQAPEGVPDPARTGKNENAPIELLEDINGQWLDTRATGEASCRDPQMEPVGVIDRAADRRGKKRE